MDKVTAGGAPGTGDGYDGVVSVRAMPRWYGTLFVTDTLERFGFYGMQAILVLYAAAPLSQGGLGLAAADAASLFGAWIGLMFLLSLGGGWAGDRLLGQRPAMLAGTLLSGAGYLMLAVPSGVMTAVGLGVLAIGGGLFKPNHQALINLMFGGSRGRESGISLMYVGVQVSALIAPLVTGYLGERVSWHLGFSVAAVAALATGAVLASAAAQFGGVGDRPPRPLGAQERRVAAARAAVAGTVLAVVLAALAIAGALGPRTAIMCTGLLSVVLPPAGYLMLYRNRELSGADRRRLRAFLAVLLGSALFWMIIAHAASLLTLFARDHVDLDVLGFRVPVGWLQAATPLFILVLAPMIASALPRIGGRRHVPVKFATGLLLVGGGFLLMSVAAGLAAGGARISPLWLIVVYLTHACGEVVVAAVTISALADVLPRPFMGRVVGVYWLFAALGGGLGSGVVRLAEVVPEDLYYLGLGLLATLAGLAFLLRRAALSRALATGDQGEAAADGPGPRTSSAGV
ncbi:oligopeptide:H+ symporter [Sphaerisporangium sp. TRM90804]|uniref:peptide MFS transporter n=1 Tax=Sphaerisporangium sp. TRM90804 TaxID=3031113 RepID=UPI0024477E6D|nr:oligopeptide:H+ symporter [Sphaerisporangium sp. TRM90804]MDH2427523.1 oligopeptide:H+ symporter [Sphaerisporangium sp. TRM90804]